MAYEPFDKLFARVDEPTIAIAPNGRIALNSASCRLLEQAGVEAVRILWDKEVNGIALQSARKADINSYSITFAKGYNAATLGSKSFLRYVGWSSKRRQVISAKWNAQQKMLEAKLPGEFIGLAEQRDAKRKTKTGL